jgi:hypothetical protein
MNPDSSSTKTVIGVVPKLVQLLEPLSPDERQRAISAAMIIFGQAPLRQTLNLEKEIGEETYDVGVGISAKAASWMKKNGLTRDQIDHVFSIEPESIDVIAAKMPETGKRKQTVQAYVLCGVGSFLRNGDPTFADQGARAFCAKVGCYDGPNHSTYTSAFGNLVTGSKDSGWKLTNPGLSAGALIIKQLTSDTTA